LLLLLVLILFKLLISIEEEDGSIVLGANGRRRALVAVGSRRNVILDKSIITFVEEVDMDNIFIH